MDSESNQAITHASLWSGIGGFDLAASWLGWENLFHCENNAFCQKVLAYHFPGSELFPDIHTANFEKYANRINVLSAGFPCQPVSTAGKREGTLDDRWGWPSTRRAYRQVRPDVLVLENVAGLFSILEPESVSEVEKQEVELFCKDGSTGGNARILQRIQHRVIGKILEDIEADGYEVPRYADGTPIVFCVPAAGVNAPHKRDRAWIIAYSGSIGRRQNTEGGLDIEWKPLSESGWYESSNFFERIGQEGAIANPNNINGDLPGFRTQQKPQQQATEVFRSNDANPTGPGQQGRSHAEQRFIPGPYGRYSWTITDGICTAEVNTNSSGSRWNENDGKPEPGQPAQNIPDWRTFPTQPPIRSRNDELSMRLAGTTISAHRRESLKASGNAVVPALVLEFFKPIDNYFKA